MTNSPSGDDAPRSRKMAAAVIAPVLLTFAVAQVLMANRKAVPFDRAISIVRNENEAASPDAVLQGVLALVQNAGEGNIALLADKISAGKSPYQLVQISEFLVLNTKIRHAQEVAVLIAAAGADKFGDANLLHRAGLEYYLGRYVPKDYARAQLYLENPLLRAVPYSQYFLGELFAADDNPRRDLKQAMDRLQFAADSGVEEAKLRLAQLISKGS